MEKFLLTVFVDCPKFRKTHLSTESLIRIYESFVCENVRVNEPEDSDNLFRVIIKCYPGMEKEELDPAVYLCSRSDTVHGF